MALPGPNQLESHNLVSWSQQAERFQKNKTWGKTHWCSLLSSANTSMRTAIKVDLPRTRLQCKICHVPLHISVPLSFLFLGPSLTGSSCCLPPSVSFLFPLCASGKDAGCFEMKGWQEGWGRGGDIKTQRQQWKVMCGDKTSQWCFCCELECLYYVLPPKRCLMSYPAGLWVVAETGLIDFLTLHNAGLCSIKRNHQMAVLGFRTFWRLPCLPWYICLGQIIMGQKRFRLRFREISSSLHNENVFIYLLQTSLFIHLFITN